MLLLRVEVNKVKASRLLSGADLIKYGLVIQDGSLQATVSQVGPVILNRNAVTKRFSKS